MNSSRQPSVPPPAEAKPFLDYGPALPESYGETRLGALVRDPECFFVYWEGGDAVRARDLTDGSIREHPVGGTGSWYMDGRPEHEYQLELLSQGQVVARCKPLRLPRRTPANVVDAGWTPSPEEEGLLRALAGQLEPFLTESHEVNSGAWLRWAGKSPLPSSPRTRK